MFDEKLTESQQAHYEWAYNELRQLGRTHEVAARLAREQAIRWDAPNVHGVRV